MTEKITARTDLPDDIQCQHVVIDRDSPVKPTHLVDDFIEDDNHLKTTGAAEIQITDVMINTILRIIIISYLVSKKNMFVT